MAGLSKLGPKMGGEMSKKPAGMNPAGEPKEESAKHEGEGMAVYELHDHGDGSFHTVSKGEQTEHPDGHHALAHIAHKAMGGGAHFHAHHDGLGMHSHSIGENGEHSETKEHDSPEEMHSAMDEAMGGGGGGEQEPEAEGEGGPGMMGGFAG